ncbi:3976_t:CDS:2, partial [Cetraspora pellucida]
MKDMEKELVKYLKLNYGLQYQNGSFTHTEVLVDNGQLEMEEYHEIFIYEPTVKKQISSWDMISEKNPKPNSTENKSSTNSLNEAHVKLLIPTFKITYIGNILDSFKFDMKEDTKLHEQFLAETVLVGGGLIIKNALDFENKLELDLLKAYIIWTIDEIRSEHKHKRPFKKEPISDLSKLYDLNDNQLCDVKQLDAYIKQICSYQEFPIIAYEKVIPAFMRLDKQLQENFMDFHKIPKQISFEIVGRLVPGISCFHQEQNIKEFLMTNITINFPHWIKKHYLEHGLLATPNGFVNSKKKVIEFLHIPKFKIIESTYLRIFHVKNQMDLSPWTDESAISQITPLISTVFQDSKIKAIACNVIQEQLEIQIDINENEVKISNQLRDDIMKALGRNKPYKELMNVFKEYGYLFCKAYIFGNSLESISYPGMSTETKQEHKTFKRHGLTEEQEDFITTWKDFQSKFKVKSFLYDHSVVEPEEMDKWLNSDNSEYPETWHIVKRSELIPIWELLDSNIQEKIRKLFENKQILMKGEEIIQNNIRYHRIKLNPPLQRNNYHVIGSIVTNNYEKIDLTIKFQLMDCDGFSAIIEEPNIELIDSEFKICWVLIGNPLILKDFDNQYNDIKILTNSITIDLNNKRNLKVIEIDAADESEEFSPNCIIATSFDLPPMNFEPNFQKDVVLEIVNNSCQEISLLLEDKAMPISCSLVWHAIYVMQQGTKIPSDLHQIPWRHLGHHLKPELSEDAIDRANILNKGDWPKKGKK